MKNNYKIHLTYPVPFSNETIIEIEEYLPEHLQGRIKCDEKNNQIASIIVSSDSRENSELDEISQLLLGLDDTDCQPFFGYPDLENGFNAVTDDAGAIVWAMLDNCEI